MKTFKNILILMMTIFTIASCQVTDEDTAAPVMDEAGVIIDVITSPSSAILGAPEGGVDLADAKVAISDASLDLTVVMTAGNLDDIAKIEVVKSFNGGTEIVLGESTTLPYNLVVDNLADLISGTGVTEDDLRIGDVLKIRTKVTQNDGGVYYYSPSIGEYNLVINCSSNLAGQYAWGTYQPSLTLEEVSPGVYRMPYLGNFTSIYWVEFSDVCGVLTVTDWQYAGGNPLTQNEPGYVDSNGDIVFPKITVAGVSWFVDLEVRYTKL